MGMAEFADRQIGQLSGGQQQRVFLARALAQEADVLLLDEPFVGVDAATEEAIFTLLNAASGEGKTVVVVLRARRAATRTATEDALKHAYALDSDGIAVTPPALAARLGTRTRQAEKRLAQLRTDGLLHQGTLTGEGQRQAEDLIRAHRLWERYLVDTGVASDEEVHQAAEQLEHVATVAMAERLDAALGSPRSDPHGQPIPRRRPSWAALRGRPLSDLEPGEAGRTVAVREESAEGLHLLADLGLVPNTHVQVSGRDQTSLLIVAGEAEKRVDLELARDVWIGEDSSAPNGATP
jgi:DtxR family Mn-dependent transcriptional regulator